MSKSLEKTVPNVPQEREVTEQEWVTEYVCLSEYVWSWELGEGTEDGE